MIRTYGVITAAIGLVHVVYNAMWLGREAGPFAVPTWLILFEFAWTFVSFDLLLRLRRRGISPLVPAIYVVYSAFAFGYTARLGATRGDVTDAMVPQWWKVLALLAGVAMLIGGSSLARKPSSRTL